MSTLPDPKRLAVIRQHVGAVLSRAHAAVAALDSDSPVERVVDFVLDLQHAPTTQGDVTVTALLHASHDSRPEVRAAAARAMGVHPYGALLDRLAELAEDPSEEVKRAAGEASVSLRDLRPGCLQCGSDSYDQQKAVKLPESSNPHAPFVFWPVFCSSACAVDYALDRVREDVDRGELHECLAVGEWQRYHPEECPHCAKADAVGRPLPPEEEAALERQAAEDAQADRVLDAIAPSDGGPAR